MSETREGDYLEIFDNGTKYFETTYSNNKINGQYKEWHRNTGYLYIHTVYSHGILNGPYRKWYGHGSLRIRTTYSYGLIDGEYSEWHYNGEKFLETVYQQGLRQGELKVWDKNGDLLSHEYCINSNGFVFNVHLKHNFLRIRSKLRFLVNNRKYNLPLIQELKSLCIMYV